TEAEVVGARERLTRLMGLWGADTNFRLPASLPDLPAADPSLEHLESFAMVNRLDIAAARQELQARSFSLAAARNFRWFGEIRGGVNAERESEGTNVLGPAGSLELPIFDQKQAVIAQLEAEVRRGDRRLAALAVNARSEVRELRARVL